MGVCDSSVRVLGHLLSSGLEPTFWVGFSFLAVQNTKADYPVDRRRKVASGIAPHGNYLFLAKVLGVRSIEVRPLLANVQ